MAADGAVNEAVDQRVGSDVRNTIGQLFARFGAGNHTAPPFGQLIQPLQATRGQPGILNARGADAKQQQALDLATFLGNGAKEAMGPAFQFMLNQGQKRGARRHLLGHAL